MRYLLSLILLSTLAASAQNFVVEPFEVTETATGVTVQTTIKTKVKVKGTVRIPAEGLVLSGKTRDGLTEASLFGSGLSLDLNGDGDTDDVFPVKDGNGQISIAGKEFPVLSQSLDNQRTGGAKIHQIDPRGPGLVFYANQDNLVLGADYQTTKARFVELPSPFFQVMLLEPCEAPGAKPKRVLSGAEYTGYVWEPGVFSPEARWMSLQWLSWPIDKAVKVQVEGDGDALLLGRVNHEAQPGVRRREKPVFVRLR